MIKSEGFFKLDEDQFEIKYSTNATFITSKWIFEKNGFYLKKLSDLSWEENKYWFLEELWTLKPQNIGIIIIPSGVSISS